MMADGYGYGDALLQELSLQFNKVRQQSITNELLDIVGGQMRWLIMYNWECHADDAD